MGLARFCPGSHVLWAWPGLVQAERQAAWIRNARPRKVTGRATGEAQNRIVEKSPPGALSHLSVVFPTAWGRVVHLRGRQVAASSAPTEDLLRDIDTLAPNILTRECT
ncbi:uncharacterized protein B0I36DRAFT_347284 [Microdochium trichocladiopsis]|uniref:Uncharacterized protein n=1 Tax=Microdochium trichocladiopsis TaxID=1682393 RepID=A0A9P8YCR7_9PEZI|nr:uncharacterized protein B0I36DRAFT_347284 [Microdochium trichocladiopsis]KAH7035525.1 hypothetical protein B0I36DRAFT_347284 [Microdochium trichocladiopsis]